MTVGLLLRRFACYKVAELHSEGNTPSQGNMVDALSWRNPEQRDIALHKAAEVLRTGGLVALPTETTYVAAASALHPEGVERLLAVRGTVGPWLSCGTPSDAAHWMPNLDEKGLRLARKCWPGPVHVVVEPAAPHEGFAPSLNAHMQKHGIELACPDHAVFDALLERLGHPLALVPITGAGGKHAVQADEAVAVLGDRVALAIDDGPCPHRELPSAVQATAEGWELVREAAVPRRHLGFLDQRSIVFVCTGNSCRSPMAEALCKKMLADRLGCAVEELSQHGFAVRSAGLSAPMGCGAAPEAIETVRPLGGCLEGHRSQPLTRQLACEADWLLAMTNSHLRAIHDRYGHMGVRGRLLGDEDIEDPIGGDLEVYRACAEQITRCLEAVLPEVLPS